MIFRTMRRRLSRPLGAVFLCIALVASAGCGVQERGPSAVGGSSAAAAETGGVPGWARGMAVVRADELPRQARDVLALIDRGGPYPYRQDGAVFGNFEKALPRQKRGYYHEFTVRTPGERDRGARRIVTGGGGEFYYTDDHYETFKAVLR
ncbi:ribonuclease domain-containing protein [Streptomyces sp. NRRL F-2664]|uniref:ribonuclease domain-containing protein n=1 Tax=Streptomyces sp. NRRL F-2664 TaxID=1463842 RepID=UPI0004C7932C|nr:ribonuclease domain-containing protein [Streptomyces sp. NRRL F-2664]